jgi:hypothetical protein
MADVLDVLTLSEAYSALNIVTAADQAAVATELAQVITEASAILDVWVGPVVKRTVTEEHYGHGDTVTLGLYPIAGVVSVSEFASGTETVLTAETLEAAGTFAVNLAGGVIYRRAGWYPHRFAGGVRVQYEAGRFDNTAAVPALYRGAGLKIVVHLWQARGAQSGFGTTGSEGLPFAGVPYTPAKLREHILSTMSAGPVVG